VVGGAASNADTYLSFGQGRVEKHGDKLVRYNGVQPNSKVTARYNKIHDLPDAYFNKRAGSCVATGTNYDQMLCTSRKGLPVDFWRAT
jgi:hypothetical protein